MRIERPITKKELQDVPDDIIALAQLFNHKIIVDQYGTYRFKQNKLVNHILDDCLFYTPVGDPDCTHGPRYRGKLDLNELWVDFHNRKFDVWEMAQFYMGIGYSISGFCDVFSKKAHELSLEDAEPETYNEEKDYDESEDLITYMIRKG